MLNKICTDLETSKKLKELGIKEYGYFSWETVFNKGVAKSNLTQNPFNNRTDEYQCRNSFAAYTLEQILDMLPMGFTKDDKRYDLLISQNSFIYYEAMGDIDNEIYSFMTRGGEIKDKENLVNCAARLLIKLKEDKII